MAALAEHRLGALRDIETGGYMTVGIGVGLLVHGQPIHGKLHPEFGHIRVIRILTEDDLFAEYCPYHGDCLEGLASGPAIQKRWGRSLSTLPADHVAHTLIADYIGQACATLALSAWRIVIGGGVSNTPGFHAAIENRARHWLANYLSNHPVQTGNFIVSPPALGGHAGMAGAMLLADKAAFARPDL